MGAEVREMERVPGMGISGQKAQGMIRRIAGRLTTMVQSYGWRKGRSGLFLPRHISAFRERILGFVRWLLLEILPTAGTEPILPPIPALKVPLTAQTGRSSGTGGRAGGFLTHGWSFPDVAIMPSPRAYGVARG
jgi:hypothetical protein